MIDLHCHALPALDDGPGSLEGSLALLRSAASADIDTIVATPHVSEAYPDTVRCNVAGRVAALQEAADAAGIDICLLAGAEIELLHRDQSGKDNLAELRLGDGPYTLVELPFSADSRFAEMLLGMHGGLRPVVIAHPERCRAFHDDRELLGRLVADGMLAQVTAASIAGSYGSVVKATAWSMLEQGLVHVIASDAHRRPPLLREPLLEAGLGAKMIAILCEDGCEDGPAAILAGESPPPAPPVTSPRARRLRRLRSRWRTR